MVDSRRTQLKKRFCGKTGSVLSMLFMTSSFFVVEIVVGYATNSMALVADSFHMLSDVMSLLIGFFALRYSKRSQRTERNTFGWQRAEVLGALVNAVFLIALCFSILVESLKRIVEPELINSPILVLVVGSIGLLVNVVGLALFHQHGGHGHSHGGHGHSHAENGHTHTEHTHSHGQDNGEVTDIQIILETQAKDHDTQSQERKPGLSEDEITGKAAHSHDNHWYRHGGENGPNDPPQVQTKANGVEIERKVTDNEGDNEIVSEMQPEAIPEVLLAGENGTISTVNPSTIKVKSSAQLNMRGVYLHVLGDALGSVIVIISALIIMFVTGKWTIYVDPVMSILMVLLILKTSVPLLRESALILLQTVPTHIKIKEVQDRLLDNVDGVLSVHEFHVWQLAGNKIIASAHVTCQSPDDYMNVANNIKTFFHREGIHSTTIQPEFVVEGKKDSECALECGKDENCAAQKCCESENNLRKRTRITDVEGSVINPEGSVMNLGFMAESG